MRQHTKAAQTRTRIQKLSSATTKTYHVHVLISFNYRALHARQRFSSGTTSPSCGGDMKCNTALTVESNILLLWAFLSLTYFLTLSYTHVLSLSSFLPSLQQQNMRENKEKQALGDLMIKPVQRIPRYELLVKVNYLKT